MTSLAVTDRTRLKRAHDRGRFDRATVDAVLDAGVLCHVGYVVDGRPFVTPTLYWRDGDHVYWHGSSASRMIRSTSGLDVCLTVSHLDGLVLARSAFHHSVNYRSVMLFGTARPIDDAAEKDRLLARFVEGLLPGRMAEIRPPTPQELKATSVMALSIEEGSAKLRSGGPKEDEEDYALPVWAGVLPMRTVFETPQECDRLAPDTPFPPALRALALGDVPE